MNRIQRLIHMAAFAAKNCAGLVGTTPHLGFFEDKGTHMLVATATGENFLVEIKTGYFLPDLHPEDAGEIRLHLQEGKGLSDDLDDMPAIAFVSSDNTLVGVLSVGHCFQRLRKFFQKKSIRHMNGDTCLWVGLEGFRSEPAVGPGVEVQTREPGSKEWVTIPKNPVCSALDRVRVVSSSPLGTEEWSPSDGDTTDAEVAAVISDPAGMPKRQTPMAPRAPKNSKKEEVGSAASA